jgi:hypothetical protein
MEGRERKTERGNIWFNFSDELIASLINRGDLKLAIVKLLLNKNGSSVSYSDITSDINQLRDTTKVGEVTEDTVRRLVEEIMKDV